MTTKNSREFIEPQLEQIWLEYICGLFSSKIKYLYHVPAKMKSTRKLWAK